MRPLPGERISEAPSPPFRISAVLREWPVWTLIVIGAIYFAEPLVLGQTFYYRDLYSHFFPVKKTFVTLLSSGDGVLWNPFIHGGEPFLSNPNNTVLYPSNLIYLVLPLLTAFNLDIALHLILCSVCAYLLSRALDLARLPAFVAGVVFGYCGYTLSLGNLLNRLLAMPYVPLTVLFWHLFLSQGKRRYFVFAVVAGTFQFLAGAPETFLLTLVFVFCWSLCFPYERVRIRQRVQHFAMLGLLIGGLCSVQALPTFEMARESVRSATTKTTDLALWSLHPKRTPEAILPGFDGRTDALATADYWGAPHEDQGFPLILSIYFGLLSLVLAFCGAMSPPGDDEARRSRFRRFLLVFALASFVLSFGRFVPGLMPTVGAVPVLSWLRYPIKFMTGAILPLALLGGFALQSLQRSERRSWLWSSRAAWLFGTITAGFIGLFVLVSGSTGLGEQFQRFFFATSRPQIAEGLRHSMLHAGGLWVAAVLVLLHRRLRPSPWQPWALAGIVTIDLLAAGRNVNTYAPRDFFTREPELAGIIRKEIGDGRLYRVPKSQGVAVHAPANDVMYQYRWNLEVLNGYVAPLYGIPIIDTEDLDKMSARRVANLAQLVSVAPWDQRVPLLSAGSASLILTDEDLSVSGVKPIARVSTASNTAFYLYRNEAVAGPATLVHSWSSASTDEDALRVMLSPGFDPRHEVVVMGTVPPAPPTSCVSTEDRLRKIEARASSSSYAVSSRCDGTLVFSEPLYNGWSVTVDGKDRPLFRSNFAYCAVFLKAGDHTVGLRYRPKTLFPGVAVSVLSSVLLVVAVRRMRHPHLPVTETPS